MNTTTKKEVKGTQGATTSLTKKTEPARNGTAVNGELQKETSTTKSKTIEEQMKYFDGLSSLVSIKRRFETHKEALLELTISDEELVKFETEKHHGLRIILRDENNHTYEINHPKLVKDVKGFLLTTLDGKITEYNQKIMLYGQN